MNRKKQLQIPAFKNYPKLKQKEPKKSLVLSYRSSRQKCSVRKGVLGNFTKFTGKHLCQSLFFNKVAETLAQVFSCEFCQISKNTFFTEHLRATASTYMRRIDTHQLSNHRNYTRGITFPCKQILPHHLSTSFGIHVALWLKLT